MSFIRVISSVGLERCFDRAEVTGSSPVLPTRMGVGFVAGGSKRVVLKLRLRSVGVSVLGHCAGDWKGTRILGFQI